ncbi:MAG: glycoside hydrolase [bacterium]|nr:glycoside hydrolase [bacterium]
MKTLYLIHHSHTDIGYTTTQALVRRNQIGFIHQALNILDQRGLDSGFRWVCESFWAVEQFMFEATADDKERFAAAVRAGAIGLSANYANFSELLCFDALSLLTTRATKYGQDIGSFVESAMNADINGFGWGYGKALIANGVKNLFTCIHTHHGMYPLQRHRPFWWVGPEGEKLLVWNGEHYHLGNELGLAPGAVSSYMIKDECDAQTIHHDPWKVAEIRIPRLFKQLENDGYPYQFVPVMISGLRSDNAPPSAAIIDQVNRWNEAHGHEIRVKMSTIDQFFMKLRSEKTNIPAYSGDWPDWWTDGTASMPESTGLFRQAQRNWQTARQLLPAGQSSADSVLDNLALYAEHTYGHAASVVQPFHSEVQALAARKRAFAAVAHDESQTLLDSAFHKLGKVPHGPDSSLRYQVVNPNSHRITHLAKLPVEHHEYYEKFVHCGIQVVDTTDGKVLSAGIDPTPVSTMIEVPLTLEAGQKKVLQIQPTMSRNLPPDQCCPALETRQHDKTCGVFETDAFRLEWKIPQGITAWVDKSSGVDWLRKDLVHPAFMPVYSVSAMKDAHQAWSVRQAMGLSRSAANAQWSVGIVTAVRERFSGVGPGNPLDDLRPKQSPPMHQRLEFDIEVAGCEECTLVLRATEGLARIDVSFQVNKQNVWAPENLYLSLPFGQDSKDTIWLDKSGGGIRARKDQLSGTLIDYYSVQGGFVSDGSKASVMVAMKDNPLLQLGPLEYRENRVMHDPDNPYPDIALPYAWLMTNYWETNFAAGLGGFHAFRFSVLAASGEDLCQELSLLQAVNSGFASFRIG